MKKIVAIVVAFLVGTSAFGQPLERVTPESVGMSSSHLKYVDKAIEKEVKQGHIPGAVLAVVKDGAIPYLKAYGHRSTRPTVTAMKENTIFDMASCSKSLSTAIAAMILVERGQLSLRDNLDFYIPDFNKNRRVNGKSCIVRVRHLMTHTSGFASYASIPDLEAESDTLDINSIIDYVKNSSLSYAPDTNFRYSCLNFITLQYIIEKITGQSLRQFAKENIFDPLGMYKTDYLPLGNDKSKAWATLDQIAPTEVISADSIVWGEVHDPLANHVNGGISGNAGLFSTASDIAILAATILNDGEHDGKRILSPLTVKTMMQVPAAAQPFQRAIGWDVNSAYSSNKGDLLDVNAIGHTGFTGTSITIDKENNMAVILLTNAIHVRWYSSKYVIRLRSLVANAVAASIIPQTKINEDSTIINPWLQ